MLTANINDSVPKISVLLPVYNAERFIDEAIKSILEQTYTNFELLILNDGSTDNTSALIESYRLDSRIQVIEHENMGLVGTLNKGLSLAKGLYIARMDADDIAHHTRFEKQIDYLENNPEVAVLGTAINLIDEDGLFIRTICHPSRPKLDSAMLSGNFLAHPTAMIRACALESISGYRNAFLQAEDYDLWLRLKSQGYILDNLKEVLLDYRQTTGGISFSNRTTQDIVARAAKMAYDMRLCEGGDDYNCDKLITISDLKKQIGVYINKYEYSKMELLWNGCYVINKTNINCVDKRFINIRSHLINYSVSNYFFRLSFFYLLEKNYISFFINAFKSLFSSPLCFMTLMSDFVFPLVLNKVSRIGNWRKGN